MNTTLLQIPVVQIRKVEKNGEIVEEKRLVPELISPKYIVRVSPTENGTVVWLAHGAPYIQTPMTYEQFLQNLEKLKDVGGEARNTDR